MSELYAEIERLTRELEHEVSISRRANNRLVDLDTEIERLTGELEMKQLVENRLRLAWDESDKEAKRLRAALDWYARNLGASKSKDMRIIVQDGGARAREALGEPKP